MPWLDSPRSALAALGPFYRRYLRLPLGLSAIAIIVNLPAFFELIVVPCVMPPTRKAPDVLRLGNRVTLTHYG
jgi:hypothetical protein